MVRRKPEYNNFRPNRCSTPERNDTRILVNRRSYHFKALREIRRIQSSVRNLIPRLSFGRLVKDILYEISPTENYKIQTLALEALQESTEMYIISFLEDSYMISLHCKRVTLMLPDLLLLRRLRGRKDLGNR